MNRKTEYEHKARAYELLLQHIQRMTENDGYAGESSITLEELDKIKTLLENKRNRKIELGNRKPKPRAKANGHRTRKDKVIVLELGNEDMGKKVKGRRG